VDTSRGAPARSRRGTGQGGDGVSLNRRDVALSVAAAGLAGLGLRLLPVVALIGLLGVLVATAAGCAWLLCRAAAPDPAPVGPVDPTGPDHDDLAGLVRRLDDLEAREGWVARGVADLEAYAQAALDEGRGAAASPAVRQLPSRGDTTDGRWRTDAASGPAGFDSPVYLQVPGLFDATNPRPLVDPS
jgi:hypothetical protein